VGALCLPVHACHWCCSGCTLWHSVVACVSSGKATSDFYALDFSGIIMLQMPLLAQWEHRVEQFSVLSSLAVHDRTAEQCHTGRSHAGGCSVLEWACIGHTLAQIKVRSCRHNSCSLQHSTNSAGTACARLPEWCLQPCVQWKLCFCCCSASVFVPRERHLPSVESKGSAALPLLSFLAGHCRQGRPWQGAA
jgi:hypothetical protein